MALATSGSTELLGVGEDRDDSPAAALGELHRAGRAREERVVLADADTVAGLEAGAPLAHDDLAAGDDLAGEDLHAEAVGVGVAAVAGGAEALLVCHYSSASWLAGAAAASCLGAAGSLSASAFLAGGLRESCLISVTSIRVSSWRWPVRRL